MKFTKKLEILSEVKATSHKQAFLKRISPKNFVEKIKYLNNMIEQDHSSIKKRAGPALGFKNFHAVKATLSCI